MYGDWHESKYFIGYCAEDRKSVRCYDLRLFTSFLWVFEMKTKRWSEIRLNFSFNKYSYQSNVDSDGVLNFILHGNDGSDNPSQLAQFDVTLIRMPLK